MSAARGARPILARATTWGWAARTGIGVAVWIGLSEVPDLFGPPDDGEQLKYFLIRYSGWSLAVLSALTCLFCVATSLVGSTVARLAPDGVVLGSALSTRALFPALSSWIEQSGPPGWRLILHGGAPRRHRWDEIRHIDLAVPAEARRREAVRLSVWLVRGAAGPRGAEPDDAITLPPRSRITEEAVRALVAHCATHASVGATRVEPAPPSRRDVERG